MTPRELKRKEELLGHMIEVARIYGAKNCLLCRQLKSDRQDNRLKCRVRPGVWPVNLRFLSPSWLKSLQQRASECSQWESSI